MQLCLPDSVTVYLKRNKQLIRSSEENHGTLATLSRANFQSNFFLVSLADVTSISYFTRLDGQHSSAQPHF
jgi:hypothetical protein